MSRQPQQARHRGPAPTSGRAQQARYWTPAPTSRRPERAGSKIHAPTSRGPPRPASIRRTTQHHRSGNPRSSCKARPTRGKVDVQRYESLSAHPRQPRLLKMGRATLSKMSRRIAFEANNLCSTCLLSILTGLGTFPTPVSLQATVRTRPRR